MADGGELTAAAATGDLKVCFLKAAFLLYVDVNLNYTSIVKAILKKRPVFFQAVKTIIDRGVDVNSYSPEGFRPLCIAAFWAYNDIVQLLLDWG